MAVSYLHDQERADLQADIPDTRQSLHDLRVTFYGSRDNATWSKENDLIRKFLIAQTGAVGVQSINDLWRLYAIHEGVANQTSLSDMLKQLYAANDLGSGQPYGLLLSLTQA